MKNAYSRTEKKLIYKYEHLQQFALKFVLSAVYWSCNHFLALLVVHVQCVPTKMLKYL